MKYATDFQVIEDPIPDEHLVIWRTGLRLLLAALIEADENNKRSNRDGAVTALETG